MSFPQPKAVALKDALAHHEDYDLSIVVSASLSSNQFEDLEEALLEAQRTDPRIGKRPSLVSHAKMPGGRCLHVPIGELARDYDDVRRFFDMGKAIAEVLSEVDAINPLLILDQTEWPTHKANAYQFALENVYLGICQQLWQPLEARQNSGAEGAFDTNVLETVHAIALVGIGERRATQLAALESGKRVARDLCGTEPERMAPIGFANYCETVFKNSPVQLDVISDLHTLKTDYPCLHAVARASLAVERHHPRVITLRYDSGKVHGEQDSELVQTLFLAGKGITYDTGGADLKVNGHMAGMSRDKGGAAAVAGFMKTIAQLKPKGIKVVASIAAVRNSIGADAYVPDEIITSHAGVRVRVGNTDAEGRMVLTDILSHMREEALGSASPQIFSIATLTGHAAIAFGPYTALLENQVAINQSVSANLIDAGERWSDPCEQSRVRREDYDFIKPKTKADDVLSSNNAPSVSTVRGHQFPMAFLSIASGLDKHNIDSDKPLPYTHVDIAGSGVEGLNWQHGKPTAAPVAAFFATYILPQLEK
uniref:M17 family metallopeptidase n=1 Tax=Ningiella ruwaisensis TaxID=2364274 RepID=UPI00109FC1CD|nr:leucyl aminopeptidase family protein [Ningiella ruwaisensis]